MTGWKFAYQANGWGQFGGAAPGVTSIGDLSYRSFGDLEQALTEIARAGFEGVEMFDGNLLDTSPVDLAILLAVTGLTLTAVYLGGNFIYDDVLPDELDRIARAADRAGELGALHLVVGGGARRRQGTAPDDIQRLGAALDKVGDIAAARGMSRVYHPSHLSMIETTDQIDAVLQATRVGLCPDTGDLAAAGNDPVTVITRNAGRIGYVHLKGVRHKPFSFTPLDQGDLELAPVLDALRRANYAGWMCVELDLWNAPEEGARLNAAWLRRMLGPQVLPNRSVATEDGGD